MSHFYFIPYHIQAIETTLLHRHQSPKQDVWLYYISKKFDRIVCYGKYMIDNACYSKVLLSTSAMQDYDWQKTLNLFN